MCICNHLILNKGKIREKPLDNRHYLLSRGLEFVVISRFRRNVLKVLQKPFRVELRLEGYLIFYCNFNKFKGVGFINPTFFHLRNWGKENMLRLR